MKTAIRRTFRPLRHATSATFMCILAATTQAEDAAEGIANVFFGFDMVLTPIALKGACGADVSGDVEQINSLISAYPDDAKSAGIPDHLEVLRMTSWAQNDPSLIIGNSLSLEQMDEMCRLAGALTLDWITPSAPRKEPPPAQQDAWRAFLDFLEST